MGRKVYAVKKGFKIGIFKSWDECKKQVDGFSGAIYKSFNTIEEAESFIDLGNNKDVKLEDVEVIAYVDGSYNVLTKEFSYGMVIIHDDIEKHFCEKYNDRELVDMRNVAGEIMGATKAIMYCIENGFKSIKIHYDYEGIEKWCNGVWKTNKLGTKLYKAFYDKNKDRVNIIFKKVKAHSGDKYNDIADKLAKSALGL